MANFNVCCTAIQSVRVRQSTWEWMLVYPMDEDYGKEVSHPACPEGAADGIALDGC